MYKPIQPSDDEDDYSSSKSELEINYYNKGGKTSNSNKQKWSKIESILSRGGGQKYFFDSEESEADPLVTTNTGGGASSDSSEIEIRRNFKNIKKYKSQAASFKKAITKRRKIKPKKKRAAKRRPTK